MHSRRTSQTDVRFFVKVVFIVGCPLCEVRLRVSLLKMFLLLFRNITMTDEVYPHYPFLNSLSHIQCAKPLYFILSNLEQFHSKFLNLSFARAQFSHFITVHKQISFHLQSCIDRA
jgi:hypothetical protein